MFRWKEKDKKIFEREEGHLLPNFFLNLFIKEGDVSSFFSCSHLLTRKGKEGRERVFSTLPSISHIFSHLILERKNVPASNDEERRVKSVKFLFFTSIPSGRDRQRGIVRQRERESCRERSLTRTYSRPRTSQPTNLNANCCI